MRLTIRLKKRAQDSEFEKLHCAAQELIKEILEEMMDIPPSVVRRMRKAGIDGGRAGARLRKLRRKICLKK